MIERILLTSVWLSVILTSNQMLWVTDKALMGLKSFGMIYLAVLDNQKTITTRQKKKSNQRDKLSLGTCLSAAVLPALSWAQISIFYKKGYIRAVCNHSDMPGCERQSILIYSQALTMVLVELAQLLLTDTSVKHLLLFRLWGHRLWLSPLHW